MNDSAITGSNWSENEVQRAVASYFEMLRAEILDQPYSKTAYRSRLAPLLAGRSNGSIEFKHQNVSAVLVHLGLPYIDGYKPRGNYQALLAKEVEQFLAQNPGFFEGLADAPALNPQQIPEMPVLPAEQFFDAPPDRIETPAQTQPWVLRQGRKIDFVRRDAANRHLGKLGEEFVLGLERRRLEEEGRGDLARKVEWISDTRGDGVGFDILSFNRDESERWVEVKTTALGKFFPFYVSANEVRCSEACSDRYHLYRVHSFSRSPRVYVLDGSLSKVCRLAPIQYLAAI